MRSHARYPKVTARARRLVARMLRDAAFSRDGAWRAELLRVGCASGRSQRVARSPACCCRCCVLCAGQAPLCGAPITAAGAPDAPGGSECACHPSLPLPSRRAESVLIDLRSRRSPAWSGHDAGIDSDPQSKMTTIRASCSCSDLAGHQDNASGPAKVLLPIRSGADSIRAHRIESSICSKEHPEQVAELILRHSTPVWCQDTPPVSAVVRRVEVDFIASSTCPSPASTPARADARDRPANDPSASSGALADTRLYALRDRLLSMSSP